MSNDAKLRKFIQRDNHNSDQDYHEILIDTAHYNAEKYGFVPEFKQEDLVETEYEIRSMLNLQ